MDIMSLSEFRKLRIETLDASVPLHISVEGTPRYIFCRKEDVIPVADLHIRVRNKLRALEKRARMGMPEDKQIFADEVQELLPVVVPVEEEEIEEAIRTAEDGYADLLHKILPKGAHKV